MSEPPGFVAWVRPKGGGWSALPGLLCATRGEAFGRCSEHELTAGVLPGECDYLVLPGGLHPGAVEAERGRFE